MQVSSGTKGVPLVLCHEEAGIDGLAGKLPVRAGWACGGRVAWW
jgi:hypothetical protein